MKTHYSCVELAAMKLTGYPTTSRAWLDLAKNQAWDGQPRSGRGGGFEYLPSKAVQDFIKTHNLSEACKVDKEALEEHARAGRLLGKNLREDHENAACDAKMSRQQASLEIMARWPQLTNNQVSRMTARYEIVQSYSEWLKTQQGKTPEADPNKPRGACGKKAYKPRAVRSGNKSLNTFAASYNTTKGTLVSADACAAIGKISGRNLRRWVDGFARLGFAGLLDEKDGKALAGHGKIEDQEPLKALVVGMLVDFPHVTNKHIEDAILVRFGAVLSDVHTSVKEAHENGQIARPSLDGIKRFRDGWTKKHGSAYLALRNPDKWKNENMLAFGDASGDVTHPNYRWEMDSTPGDLLLLDPDAASGQARYHVLGTMDIWSHRFKMLVAKSSKSIALGSLIRRAILDWGVPERRKADNGKDYQSNYLNRFFDAIGCEREDCAPFSGWQKPHVERGFRTFNHDLVELLPGYIGHNVAERKELEARASFSERLFKKDGVLEVSMTAAEFQQFCDNWCDKVYAHNPHSGLDGMTPFAKMASWDKPISRLKDERALDVLLAPLAGTNNGQFSLQKKGIRINKAWYIHAELARHTVGDRLSVSQDVADMGRVFVFDAQGQFVCVAENPELTGVSQAEIANEAKAIQREEMKEQKAALKKVAKKANVKNMANEIMQRRIAESDKVSMLPQTSTTHTTPGINAAALAARDGTAPQVSAQHDKLMAEARQMCMPKAQVIQHPAFTPTPLEGMNDEQKYTLWLEFDAVKILGHELTEAWQQRFHAGYPKTSAFRAMRAMHQEKSPAEQQL